ncbi:hypothetical protein ACH3VS_40905 [Streptomyces sp. WSLK1-3]|uniref:hypothetical protein n=1 Tax=Streptomyces sp. WSLK1-3 TaxID=3375475 RepID=UPI0037AECCDA
MSERLKDYHGKRDFGRTREPEGRRADAGGAPRFVVQIFDFAQSLEQGHATFRLRGTKLRGTYALTRFREDNWLLVKTAEGRASGHGTPDPRRARSVRSGRTPAQVADAET